MQRRAGQEARGEERTDLVTGWHAVDGLTAAPALRPPQPGPRPRAPAGERSTRAPAISCDLPYGPAQEPHILRMKNRTCS